MSCSANIEEQNNGLAADIKPNDQLYIFDVQQTALIKQEAPEEWKPAVDQEIQETLNIKKEEEELWISLEEEQLNVKEEVDATRFPLTAVSWSADQMTSTLRVEDCGGAGTTKNPDPNTNKYDSTSSETEVSEDDEEDKDVNNPDSILQHVTDSGSVTEDSDSDWMVSRAPKTGDKKIFSCSKCSKQFDSKRSFLRHVASHSSCSSHKKHFREKKKANSLRKEKTRQKSFSCNECGKRFTKKYNLNRHIHTGHKPFCCEVCGQNVNQKSNLNRHTVGQKSI